MGTAMLFTLVMTITGLAGFAAFYLLDLGESMSASYDESALSAIGGCILMGVFVALGPGSILALGVFELRNVL